MSTPRISDSNRPSSADALASNTLSADAAKTEEVDQQKQDPKAAKPEKKPTTGTAAFTSLDDIEKQGGLAALLKSDLNKLIIGLGTSTGTGQGAVAGASTELIEQAFAPLLDQLPSAPSKEKPGIAFLPEGFAADFAPRASYTTQKIVLVTQSDAATANSTTTTGAPANSDANKLPADARQHPDARVRWVRFHQELTDKMFKQLGADQKLPVEISTPVAAAAAMARAREMGLWRQPIKSTGPLSTMRADLANALEDVGPSLANAQGEGVVASDIELPSPELVEWEKAAGAVKHHTTSADATAQGIDFLNGDVESVAILVMMGGLKVENKLTLDLLKNIQTISNQKDQLRKLATKAKEDETSLNKEMQNEFNTLKAAGVLHSTITFEQYKSWREIAYAGLSENIGSDLTTSYAMPSPQLTQPTPPDSKSIPDWLKTGTVGKPDTADSDKQTGVAKGMPPQIMAQLRAIYRASGTTDSFEDFLSNTIGLTNCYDIDDIVANLSIAKQFLSDAKTNPSSLIPTSAIDATAGVNQVALKKLQDQFTELAKFEVLSQFFPNMVDASFVAQKKKEFMDSMVALKLNDATATKFEEWKKTATPPKNEDGSDFVAQVRAFIDARTDKSKYTPDKGQSVYKGSGDDSFIDQSDRGRLRGASEVQFYITESGQVQTVSIAKGFTGDADDAWSTNNTWDVVSTWDGGSSSSDTALLGMLGAAAANKPKGGSKLQGSIGMDVDPKLLKTPAIPSYTTSSTVQDPVTGQWVQEVTVIPEVPERPPQSEPTYGVAGSVIAVVTADTLGAELKKKQQEDAEKKIGTAATNGLNAMTDLGDPANENSDYRKWARKNGLDKDFEAQKSDAQKAADLAAAAAKANAGVPVDAATGIALGNIGTLEMFGAKSQEIKDRLDTLNGMSEIESIRLQAQMERRAKFLETLSNMLKGIASTSKTIRDNTGK